MDKLRDKIEEILDSFDDELTTINPSDEMYEVIKASHAGKIAHLISKQLAKEKMELVEKIWQFVHENEDCGACILGMETKRFLEALKSELQEKEEVGKHRQDIGKTNADCLDTYPKKEEVGG